MKAGKFVAILMSVVVLTCGLCVGNGHVRKSEKDLKSILYDLAHAQKMTMSLL